MASARCDWRDPEHVKFVGLPTMQVWQQPVCYQYGKQLRAAANVRQHVGESDQDFVSKHSSYA